MNLLKRLLPSKEVKLEPVLQNALDGVLAEIYAELGLGVFSPSNGSPEGILEHLGAVKQGIVRYKEAYISTEVMRLVREGRKVPKWMQKMLGEEIQLRGYTGEPEDLVP